MDSAEYFDRVVRFLETKGWNTARTRINAETYVVTGTRESDTYYDRMLTMVAVDEGATLSERHVEYLVEAGAEHDVDHLLATARGGLTDDAAALADERNVTFIDTGTIDDAFIDGFSVGDDLGDGIAGGTFTGNVGGSYGTFLLSAGYPLSVFALAALAFGLLVFASGRLGGEGALPALAPGAVLLAGPVLALVAGVSLPVDASGGRYSGAGVFAGTVGGYLLLLCLVGVAAAAGGTVGSTGLFAPPLRLLAAAAFAVPTGAIAAVAAYVKDRSRRAFADGGSE